MENRILGLLSGLFASEPRGVKAELPAKTEQRQEATERDTVSCNMYLLTLDITDH
jgi:hypothetical protein